MGFALATQWEWNLHTKKNSKDIHYSWLLKLLLNDLILIVIVKNTKNKKDKLLFFNHFYSHFGFHLLIIHR